MNTQYHAYSLNDEDFDIRNASTSTPTSKLIGGNSFCTFQQTPPSTKRVINLQTSDEYYTANEESFDVTINSMNNSITQPNNTSNNASSGLQGAVTTSTIGITTMAARKQMFPADQNEPAKPLSAYALFFRDTVSAIKQQNPTCSFQELSKIVASMWDALDPVHKGVYNKKNEIARTEYLKQMRVYQQQKQEQLNANANEAVQIDTNATHETVTPSVTNNITTQQNTEQVNNNNVTAINSMPTPSVSSNSSDPSGQMRLSTESAPVQKCTRENCNKRAIINPDWEDEYCSNECVIIHCRNVFNAWVQSNFEAKQQEQN